MESEQPGKRVVVSSYGCLNPTNTTIFILTTFPLWRPGVSCGLSAKQVKEIEDAFVALPSQIFFYTSKCVYCINIQQICRPLYIHEDWHKRHRSLLR